jgi:hypothetical protein
MLKLIMQADAPKPLVVFDSFASALNYSKSHLFEEDPMAYRVFQFSEDQFGLVKVYTECDQGPTGFLPQYKAGVEVLNLNMIEDYYRNLSRRGVPLSLDDTCDNGKFRKLPFVRATQEELNERQTVARRLKPNLVYNFSKRNLS